MKEMKEMKEIIEEWKDEVIKRHGDAGYTFITIKPGYPNDHIIVTTSHRLFWMGINDDLFNKHSKELNKKGYTVEVKKFPFNSVIYSIKCNLL